MKFLARASGFALICVAAGCAKHQPVEIKKCTVRAIHAKGAAPYLAYTISLENTTDRIIEATEVQYANPGSASESVYAYRTPLDAKTTQTVMFATNAIPHGATPRSGPLDCSVVSYRYRT
ncbi:MAG: hypothetical protein JO165_11980 [Candidatus Eremiobacteraeota bacterium]|nr:hypothetical protein [Candidatus Eremiobacteraeota bacterium]